MARILPTIKGEMITLRPLNNKIDHLAWFEVEQDEKMHLWVGNSVPTSTEEVKKYLYDLYPRHFMIWMIEENKTGKVIGMMRISYPERHKQLLIAGDSQRLHSSYWRKGIMKEARKLINNYVFNELKVDLLIADVWEGNINSSKSLEATGYKLVEIKEEYFKKYNRMQNKLYYELSSRRWNGWNVNTKLDNFYKVCCLNSTGVK